MHAHSPRLLPMAASPNRAEVTPGPPALQLLPAAFCFCCHRSVALLKTVIVGAVNVLATFVSIACVDRMGRRTLLLQGGLQMMASLVSGVGRGAGSSVLAV
jgi:hypothetical protein